MTSPSILPRPSQRNIITNPSATFLDDGCFGQDGVLIPWIPSVAGEHRSGGHIARPLRPPGILVAGARRNHAVLPRIGALHGAAGSADSRRTRADPRPSALGRHQGHPPTCAALRRAGGPPALRAE